MSDLRIGQVANLLAISTDTVRTWIDDGKFHLVEPAEGTELSRVQILPVS